MMFLFCLGAIRADEPAGPTKSYDRSKVGEGQPRRIVVPTNQVLSPLGRQVTFGGRPVDMAASPDGRWLGVLDRSQVLVVDSASGRIASRAPHKDGSYAGIVFTPDGRRLLASSNLGTIGVFDVSADGGLHPQSPIKLPAAPGAKSPSALPIGLAIDRASGSLWAVLNLNNTLAEVDLASGGVKREIPVGNAPYGVALARGKAYVTNWAGRKPDGNSTVGPSGIASPVRVDPLRHIASDGSVSIVELATGKELAQLVVGLHPAAVIATPDEARVIVANANSDSISVIDTARDEIVETFSTRPTEKLLFGSAPGALATSADGRTLYVANSANNAVAVFALDPPHSRLLGCFPTGWYPAALVLDAKRDELYVANAKGIGSRSTEWRGERRVKGRLVEGFNSRDDQLGTISLVPIPSSGELPALTETVLANNRLTESISALAPARPDAAPRPLPERHGEPSPIKHVVYIVKENRTYDQVFGDVKRGEGDESLCIFGQQVTPNHHKLADEFVLLDNFYCSGVLSADGHQWAMEAYVTDYIERGFGGWPRSYPYDGGDAMAYASSGFLWDAALRAKKSLRIYGEFVDAQVRWKDPSRRERPSFKDCYDDFIQNTGKIEIRGTAAIKTLEPYLCPTAIGFPTIVPDVYRAEQFIAEWNGFEREGSAPNLSIVLLPNDHTSGTRPGMPTPEAAVADNDLALGRIVEAISHGKLWSETAIFVVQDDPQNGFDHVDGHRTVALVISPYTPRHAVDSTNYNQTGMVRTIELILGLPPMNQMDASATPMIGCFGPQANLTPYDAVKNNIPLDRLNPPMAAIRDPRQLHWARASLELPLDDVDEADEDTLNRILWHSVRGRDDTYPAWAVLADAADDEDERQ